MTNTNREVCPPAQIERERRAEEQRRKAAEQRWQCRERFASERLLPQWRKGGDGGGYMSDPVKPGRGIRVSVGDIPYPVLRLRDDAVESSHGATVPVAVARRALAAIDTRATLDDVGGYGPLHCNGVGVRIGCHQIPWCEVRDFCTHAGWPVPAPAAE